MYIDLIFIQAWKERCFALILAKVVSVVVTYVLLLDVFRFV